MPVVPVTASVQVVGLNVPVELEAKIMLPVGVMGVATSVSVTVALQLIVVLAGAELGEQSMTMEVARLLTITLVPPSLS